MMWSYTVTAVFLIALARVKAAPPVESEALTCIQCDGNAKSCRESRSTEQCASTGLEVCRTSVENAGDELRVVKGCHPAVECARDADANPVECELGIVGSRCSYCCDQNSECNKALLKFSADSDEIVARKQSDPNSFEREQRHKSHCHGKSCSKEDKVECHKSKNPCHNGGTCKKKKCECMPGFTGALCETDLNPCRSGPCKNGGTCANDGEGGFTCTCPRCYSSDRCQNKKPCCPNPCQNSGTCQGAGNSFTCQCTQWYTGRHCETEVDPCGCDPCVNGGTCKKRDAQSYTCQCPEGFTGPRCETTLPNDPCMPNPCRNGGTCDVRDGQYRCNCRNGFTGRRCETEVNDPCRPNPCNNGGSCRPKNSGSGFKCNCPDGFTGARCNKVVDPCASGPCLNDGICNNLGNGRYRCECYPWYTGEHCESEIDACRSEPCKNGGTCRSLHGDYECTCPPGYNGNNCDTGFGFTCAEDNNPCNGPGSGGKCNFHFPHVNPAKFVQCNEWGTMCFELPCPPGLIWHHDICTCNRP